MPNFLNKFFGTKSDREVKKLQHAVGEINGFFEEYESLNDDQLRAKTDEFKSRLQDGETVDDLLPEAFAAVKSACKRLVGKSWEAGGAKITWDMIPYDVQLIGGVVLHQGRIAEMATGEGKTLVATMPLYLNALEGEGSHLITVNDYLARRDAEWMGGIYEMLGMTVGINLAHMPYAERYAAYRADITYGTNNEFGFDYLRDNMSVSVEGVVQRKHHYAIVDEVDSVLIDEARTPLIISGPVSRSTHKFDELKGHIQKLVRKQNDLANKLIADAEKLFAEETNDAEYEAGTKILLAHRAAPKNKRLLKLMQETGTRKLRTRVENDYLRDKRMPEIDEQLYFVIDEHHHTIDLTEMGRDELAHSTRSDASMFILPDMAEEQVRIDNLEVDEETKLEMRQKAEDLFLDRSERNHNIGQLLRAHMLYESDIEYVIEDGARIVIVDEFTGRLQYGRRYSDGLHQAIEAKEGVKIERETQTIATVTLQNYFRLYDKLAGMTGTAETEEQEFYDIYKLDVVVAPTNQTVIRKDIDDVIYKTRKEKYEAILSEVEDCYHNKQPILVGTTNVEVSETLARLLKRRKIPHEVLNAKHHAREAEIITRAGQPGSVTIATNMAGRGTDIKLGKGVVEVGGLQILGTERHESRRIDRQLRGRSGRQGDPGVSKFFLSLEDDLMRLFGSERIAGIMDRLGVKEGEVITHPMITKSIEKAQKRVEAQNFAIRKHLLEYDDVMNRQREVIYERRRRVLFGEDIEDLVLEMMNEWIEDLFLNNTEEDAPMHEWNLDDLQRSLGSIARIFFQSDAEEWTSLGRDEVMDRIKQEGRDSFERRKGEIDSELLPNFLQGTILAFIDEEWKDHLYEMDRMKEGVGLRAYGQRDPLVEYKREGFELFGEMLNRVNEKALRSIFQSKILSSIKPAESVTEEQMTAVHRQAAGMAYAHAQTPQEDVRAPAARAQTQGQEPGKQQPIRKGKAPGRNDPCPCGSGKKYKHCHGG
ncbi:preprotein translocase subunit SecA [candidate division LCP-89 bacterium B3_LCP]|uniref:Protein translocase subunit SecA n=1 Tax=candidate division LCP-89 bacterium B3_LCP TaxID=2012998 RepID=A0A532V3F4_UNCL8|nr:MAG: preprotein translocase subunit SecA [candidate division LCP-89 bacterium B3_LCP]